MPKMTLEEMKVKKRELVVIALSLRDIREATEQIRLSLVKK
jgi:hypothetical protein